ncbi:MAG: hypothetical protein RR840_06410 [Clostridium sp.]
MYNFFTNLTILTNNFKRWGMAAATIPKLNDPVIDNVYSNLIYWIKEGREPASVLSIIEADIEITLRSNPDLTNDQIKKLFILKNLYTPISNCDPESVVTFTRPFLTDSEYTELNYTLNVLERNPYYKPK